MMKDISIPLSLPNIGDEERNAVLEVLESGWLAHGKYNGLFEESFAKFIGVKNAITMNSCTSALELALKVYGIKGEVVVPSFTFVASANAIVNAGALPVFCDVDVDSRNARAEDIECCLSSNTEAVMVVHFGGQPCAMDAIVDLCQRHGLLLIEDSAETIGATWEGKQAGSFGVGCFSFFPTKNMTTGEGGILTCDDDNIAKKVRSLIGHGISSTTAEREKSSRPWYRASESAGHNYRMSNLLAAIGYHQFKKLKEMNKRRQFLAEQYSKGIKRLDLPAKIPKVIKGATHVYQMYTVIVDPAKRDTWVLDLRDRGVGASVHFDPPVHLQPFYLEKYPNQSQLDNTELLAKSLITLPIYPGLSEQQVEQVLGIMAEIMHKW
jgi:perosamine synthetase